MQCPTRPRFSLFFLAAFFAAQLPAALAQAPASDPSWPNPQWQQATPEEMGMDSGALAALVEYGANAQMDSLVVVRHGKVVTEAYYAPFKAGMKHRVNSVTKSVVAALVGIASGRGLLGGTDTPVLDFFGDRPAAGTDARKKAMTLQTLLDMTSGIDWTEPLDNNMPETMIALERSPDWQQFILDRPMARQPGSGFNYNSGNSHLVSAILARKTGMSTQDFAAQQLFKPLGITDFSWRQDPQGISIGGYGLYLQTPDMAKFGYLYLHRGAWKGEQVVPREWVGKVFKASVPMFAAGGWRYGDFWWTLPESKAYLAVGFNRQLIIVLPEIGVVAAMTGRTHYPIEDVIKHLTGSVKSELALAPDPRRLAMLLGKVRDAATEKATTTSTPAPALAAQVSGKTYTLGPNDLGWKALTLHFTDTPRYDLAVYTARGSSTTRLLTRPLGTDGRFATSDPKEGIVVASQGHWVDDSTFSMTVRLPEEGATSGYRLRFDGARVEITQTNERGQRRTVTGEAER